MKNSLGQARALILFFVGLFFTFPISAQTAYVLIPEGLVRITADAVVIRMPKGGELSFLPGLGWSPNVSPSQPAFAGNDVYVTVDVAEYLGLPTDNTVVLSKPSTMPPVNSPLTIKPPTETEEQTSSFDGEGNSPDTSGTEETKFTEETNETLTPSTSDTTLTTPEPAPVEDTTGPARATNIRFGGTGSIRVVFDLAGAVDRAALGRSIKQGRLEEGQRLELSLPPLQLPVGDIEPYQNIEVTAQTTPTETRVNILGPTMNYQTSILENPLRYVIDMVPLSYANITPITREVRPGVVYKHFAANTNAGSTGVHVVEIAPNVGEFRVVGNSGQAAPMTTLASGALTGINAGYFDVQSFVAIGLLKVDHGMLSYPSRNRASIAFGSEPPIIDRVTAQLNVRINGKLHYSQSSSNTHTQLAVHTQSGALVGSSDKGVITVAGGHVVENKIGPRPVPTNGFALVYEPDIRELALVGEGNQAAIEVEFAEPAFASSRYAIEAGPLLVKNGQAAYNPDLEQFKRGERILDAYTQQAAIGVKPDGTVLLVTADNMVAADLIPLFLSLGADSAMRMDSGSSTSLYLEGNIVNRRTSERKVVTAIIFVPTPSVSP
ncbi:MAG: phosphodiester glycosidase family protein [Trueperaceae bacterium]